MTNCDETSLWCIRVPGPDDLYAAASWEDAERMAAEHNACIRAWIEKNPLTEYDPTEEALIAVVETWPWSAESHAEALARLADEAAKHKRCPDV